MKQPNHLYRFAIALLVLLTPIGTVVNGWEVLPSGTVNATTFVTSADEQRMIVGTGESGYHITQNGGNSWELFNPLLPNLVNSYSCAIAVDANADTIFMGVESRNDSSLHFLYTTDGALTWQTFRPDGSLPYLSGGQKRILDYDRQNHSRIWYFQPAFIMVTEDAGTAWTASLIDSVEYTVGAFFQDPDQPNVLWASGGFLYNSQGQTEGLNRLIRKSIDNGESWFSTVELDSLQGQDVSYSGFAWCLIKMSNGAILGGGYQRINQVLDSLDILFISSDEGVSVTRYNGGLPLWFFPDRMVEDPSHPGVVYVSGGTLAGLYRSTDYGLNFTKCYNGLPDGPTYIEHLSRNEYNGKVYVSYYGRGVYGTDDGGESWHPLPMPVMGTRASIEVFPDCIHQYHSGHVHQRYDFTSNSWTTLTFPSFSPNIASVHPIRFSAENVFVSGASVYNLNTLAIESTVTLYSTDHGQSWEQIGPVEHEYTGYYEVWQGEEMSRLFTLRAGRTSEACRTVVSYDTARTWIERSPLPGGPYQNFPAHLQDAHNLYVIIRDWGSRILFRSADEGVTWVDLEPPETPNLVHLLDNDMFIMDVFIDNYHRKLYLYDGEDWELKNPDVLINGRIIKLPGDPERLLAKRVTETLDFSLIISEDMGSTWESIPLLLPSMEFRPFLGTMKYDPYRDLIWLSTGIGLCYLPVSELGVGEGPLTPIPLDHDMISSYPNPFNDQTRIRFHLAQPGEVEITLHDVQGRKVSTILRGRYDHGLHEQHFTSGGLASGTYFLTLRRGSEVKTSRLTLLK